MTYVLDTTGLSAANFVSDEVQTVNPSQLSNYGYVFLGKGPFFGRNLVVKYKPVGGAYTTLRLGVDYKPGFLLPGIGYDDITNVFGAIEFFNNSMNGQVSISYQALGGGWTFDKEQIASYLNSNQFDASTQYVALVASPTLYLPTAPTVPWPLNSVRSITIAQAQVASIPLGVEFVLRDELTNVEKSQGVHVQSKIGFQYTDKLTTAQVAQTTFGGSIPVNGYEVINTHPTEILYIAENSEAEVGGKWSIPIKPLESYRTPQGYKPTGPVSINAFTTDHPFIARSY